MSPLKISAGVVIVAMLAVVIGFVASLNLSSETRAPETITETEAVEILDMARTASLQKDLDSLCSLGGSVLSCQSEWGNSGEWTTVPESGPAVVGTRILPDQPGRNGSVSRGGRLLEVSGVDGQGRPFNTDFLVFDEGGGSLVALNPVYWTGINVGHANSTVTGTATAVRP